MILAQQKAGDFSEKNYHFSSAMFMISLWCCAERSEPVHQTVDDPRLASPGVDGGTLLAGPHVSHSGLVPEVAHLGLVTPRRTILEMSGLESGDHLYGL